MGKWSQEVRVWAHLMGGDEKTGKRLGVFCAFLEMLVEGVRKGRHRCCYRKLMSRNSRHVSPNIVLQKLCDCVNYSNTFNL